MLLRLILAAGLIAATVVVQALFMCAELNTSKRIEEDRPGVMARQPATTTTLVWILFLLFSIILNVTLWVTFY